MASRWKFATDRRECCAWHGPINPSFIRSKRKTSSLGKDSRDYRDCGERRNADPQPENAPFHGAHLRAVVHFRSSRHVGSRWPVLSGKVRLSQDVEFSERVRRHAGPLPRSKSCLGHRRDGDGRGFRLPASQARRKTPQTSLRAL